MLIRRNICNVDSNKSTDDYNRRLLYFKVKISLVNIHPEGSGSSWCLPRDRVLRRHSDPCVNRSYALNFYQHRSCALRVSVMLLNGDIAVNPGPNPTSYAIQSRNSESSRASNSQNRNRDDEDRGSIFFVL